MENKDISQNLIKIQLPIRLEYSALEMVLQEKVIGENIKTEKNGRTSNYAEILDITVEESHKPGYDLVFYIKFRTLTTLFKNKEGTMFFHAALEFDEALQEIFIRDYDLEVNTSSWILDNSLEGIANSFFSGKIKKKMKFEFRPEIEKQLRSLNEKLANTIEVKEGISLFGYLDKFKVIEITPKATQLLLLVDFEGTMVVDISHIEL